MNRDIPIIADGQLADPELGTGCVKVTPAHDPNDYACYQRHPEIGIINILNPDGTINENGGVYKGRRVFSRATTAAMTRNQNTALAGRAWGLGWGLATSAVWSYFGELASPRTFGHSGATGTVAWADPETGLVCVILTTRPSGEDNGSLLRRVSNAVAAAVE